MIILFPQNFIFAALDPRLTPSGIGNTADRMDSLQVGSSQIPAEEPVRF